MLGFLKSRSAVEECRLNSLSQLSHVARSLNAKIARLYTWEDQIARTRACHRAEISKALVTAIQIGVMPEKKNFSSIVYGMNFERYAFVQGHNPGYIPSAIAAICRKYPVVAHKQMPKLEWWEQWHERGVRKWKAYGDQIRFYAKLWDDSVERTLKQTKDTLLGLRQDALESVRQNKDLYDDLKNALHLEEGGVAMLNRINAFKGRIDPVILSTRDLSGRTLIGEIATHIPRPQAEAVCNTLSRRIGRRALIEALREAARNEPERSAAIGPFLLHEVDRLGWAFSRHSKSSAPMAAGQKTGPTPGGQAAPY